MNKMTTDKRGVPISVGDLAAYTRYGSVSIGRIKKINRTTVVIVQESTEFTKPPALDQKPYRIQRGNFVVFNLNMFDVIEIARHSLKKRGAVT